MNKEELGKLYPVVLKDYDENWPLLFQEEKSCLESIFGAGLTIEHIGSTAITGLPAKPTIDILVEMPERLTQSQIISIMVQRDYIHMKEQKEHVMFVKGYTPEGMEEVSFHIHMGPKEQGWLWDRIYFRDYLNKNKEEAKKYALFKKELAVRYRYDREAYTDAKSGYIQRITDIAKRELQ